MANTIYWGQAAVENTNGFGKSATNNTNDFGEVCADSWSPETNLTGTGASFSNTQSTEYDGVDDYINADTAISTISTDNTGTISFWFKPKTISANQNLVTASDNTLGTRYLILGFNTSINLFCQLRSGVSSTGFLLQTDTNPLSVGTWTHIALVQDATTAKIYINAVEVAQTFTITNHPQKWLNDITNLNTFNIGSLITSGGLSGNMTNGFIDEFSYYQSALSTSDLLSIYGTGVPNDISALNPYIWYRFEGTGTTATDSGSGGNDGTLTNGVTRSTDVPT